MAGTYFDSFAVLELSALSLALNSHSVTSPCRGGGGNTNNEDMTLSVFWMAVMAKKMYSCRRSKLVEERLGSFGALFSKDGA